MNVKTESAETPPHPRLPGNLTRPGGHLWLHEISPGLKSVQGYRDLQVLRDGTPPPMAPLEELPGPFNCVLYSTFWTDFTALLGTPVKPVT